MSLLHDLARDYQPALVGFGQVFLASGILVALGYGLRARLLRRWGTSTARRPRRPRLLRRERRRQAKRRPAYFEAVTASEANADQVAAGPEPATRETHSQRIAAHIRATIARGERTVELHNRALVRLESADYALQRLVLDLAHLISVPQKPDGAYPAVPIGIAPQHATRLAA